MQKKIKDKEIVEVLTVISDSAKKVLKHTKKKDLMPVEEAERMLDALKVLYVHSNAAE